MPLSNSAAHSSVTVMAGEEWVPNFNLKMVNILRGEDRARSSGEDRGDLVGGYVLNRPGREERVA